MGNFCIRPIRKFKYVNHILLFFSLFCMVLLSMLFCKPKYNTDFSMFYISDTHITQISNDIKTVEKILYEKKTNKTYFLKVSSSSSFDTNIAIITNNRLLYLTEQLKINRNYKINK